MTTPLAAVWLVRYLENMFFFQNYSTEGYLGSLISESSGYMEWVLYSPDALPVLSLNQSTEEKLSTTAVCDCFFNPAMLVPALQL